MRVCIAHLEKSVMTLKDMQYGAEYDLCQKCVDRVMPIMNGEEENLHPEYGGIRPFDNNKQAKRPGRKPK